MLREASGVLLLCCEFGLVKSLNESKMKLGGSKAEVMVGVCRAAGAICIVVSAASVGDLIDVPFFFLDSYRNARFQIHMFFCFLE